MSKYDIMLFVVVLWLLTVFVSYDKYKDIQLNKIGLHI